MRGRHQAVLRRAQTGPHRSRTSGTDGKLTIDKYGRGTLRSLMLDTPNRARLDMHYVSQLTGGGLGKAERIETGDLVDPEPPCDAVEQYPTCVTPRAWPKP